MKVIVTGAGGQLGRALCRSVPAMIDDEPVDLIPTSRNGGQGILALNLADRTACKSFVEHFKPDWLINAGAYTAVDQAETEPDLAYAVNAGAPAVFAETLQATGGNLLQVSTDFVFNGMQGSPYLPTDSVDPLGVYGATKASGEAAASAALDPHKLCILRTSWVYGPLGNNFFLTMLRLLGERDHLGVVADQVGCPTTTAGLSMACWAVLGQQISGIHHWSDAGVASWYDFAMAIRELSKGAGLIHNPAEINPITTKDYPTLAKRPGFSLLECSLTRSCLGLKPEHWQVNLRDVIQGMVH